MICCIILLEQQDQLEFNGAFISEKEITSIMRSIGRKEPSEASKKLWESVQKEVNNKEMGVTSNQSDDDSDISQTDDELYDIIDLFVREETASISLIKRKFRMGDSRAGRIIDQIEEMGIISKQDGNKARKVLITLAEWEEMKKNFIEEDNEEE